MSLSQPQTELLQVIVASQQGDSAAIRAAEVRLDWYGKQFPGYTSLLVSLCHPALTAICGEATQLGAAIILKKYVKCHWSSATNVFEAPVVPDTEKASLYPQLLPLLATSSAKVRRQVSLTITEVAENDFPENWTSLLPDILSILTQATQPATAASVHPNLLVGALDVLANFCDTMTEAQEASTVPHLFPILIGLCQQKFELIMSVQRVSPLPQLTPAQDATIVDAIQFCIFALHIYQSCCSSLEAMNDIANSNAKKSKSSGPSAVNKVVDEYLIPSVPIWFGFCSGILTMPQASGVCEFALKFPSVWGLRLDALKTLINVSERFSSHLFARGVEGAQLYERIVGVLLESLQTIYPLYQRRVLQPPEDEEPDAVSEREIFDEYGNATTVSVFLYEVFMYFRHILTLEKPEKPASLVKPTKKGGSGKKPVSAKANALAEARYAAWMHIKSLFNAPQNVMQRLLAFCLQYGQLSAREIDESVSEIEEYLSYQQDDDITGTTVNVRNGIKELLFSCILYQPENDDDLADEMMMGGGMFGMNQDEGTGSEMLDKIEVLAILCPLLTELLQHSLQLKNTTPQVSHWWKGRELATMIVAHIVNDLIDISNQQGAPAKKGKKGAAAAQPLPQFNLQSFLSEILLPDLSVTNNAVHPLLRTQALSSTSKFAPVFAHAKQSSLVVTTLEALMANMAPQAASSSAQSPEIGLLIRIAAVDALGKLCQVMDSSILMHNNTLPTALTSICQLVHAAAQPNPDGSFLVDESALMKVLQTLQMALLVDTPTTILAEPTITPLLIAAWATNATNPHITDGVTDIFSQLLSISPATCISVQMKITEVIQQIFVQNEKQTAITGTTCAAGTLLKSVLLSIEKHTRDLKASQGIPITTGTTSTAAPELLHPLLFSSLLPYMFTIVLHNDDHDIIEVGTTVLTAFLRIDAAKVAAITVPTVMPGAPAGTQKTPMTGLALLCAIISQFLNPSLDDQVACGVGSLIIQVVFSLGSTLGEANIKELLKSVVVRLYASRYPPLTENLLLVFARLIHSSGVESIVLFLAGLGTIQVQEKILIPLEKPADDVYYVRFRAELKPAQVDALPYLLKVWTDTQSEIHSKYPTKITQLALAKLLTYLYTAQIPNIELLRNLECEGYVIETPKKTAYGTRLTTARSGGTSSSHEPVYTRIPLTTKLLKLFIQEWAEWNEAYQLEQKKAAKRARKLAKREAGEEDDESDDEDDFDEDDDDDDDEFDDDAADDAFVAQMQGKMGGASSAASPFASASDYPDFGGPKSKGQDKLITLSQMLDTHAEADEIDAETEDEVFPESITDPLNEIQLGPFLQNYFKEFASANNRAFVNDAASRLNEKDQKLLQQALESQTTPPITIAKK